MSGFRAAVGLLTRVPVASHGDTTGLDRAATWFPLVGALVATVLAGVYALAYGYMPSLLASTLAVSAGIMITGAFHEDGLADTADALGSGTTGEEALQIMRDSRVGTYGAAALIVSIVWRVVAVASLSPLWALAGLVSAHSLSRAAAVLVMAVTPPARHDGLGRAGVLGVDAAGAAIAVAMGVVLIGGALGVWAMPSVLAVLVAVVWFRWRALQAVGGITGDLLGAVEQVSEMLILGTVAVASWQGSEIWWIT